MIRQESNSDKNRIHMSDASLRLLRQQAPGYQIEERGAITIKGKVGYLYLLCF
jgi:hypothetical protein